MQKVRMLVLSLGNLSCKCFTDGKFVAQFAQGVD
jgi:hypothetical protein